MSTIPNKFEGGCACGAIRYEVNAKPVLMLHCHCRDCQRSSGGPYASFVAVPKESVKLVKGTLAYYSSQSEAGGQTRRGFCSACGCPIIGTPDVAPHIMAIRVASLDDPSWFNPQMDVWTCDALSWDKMDPSVPKFEKYPHR